MDEQRPEQRKFFDGNAAEKPHRMSRGEKLGLLDLIVLPKMKGTRPSSLLHMLRVIDGFCGNYRSCVVRRKKLVKRTGLSLPQVQRLITAIGTLGLVRIVHLSDAEGHRIANRYTPDWDALKALVPIDESISPETHHDSLAPAFLPPPENHGERPETHGDEPKTHCESALSVLDPSKDPPTPPTPANRMAHVFETRPANRLEKPGAEEVGFLDELKAEDLESVGALLAAFTRLAESGVAQTLKHGPDALALALCIATRHERKAKAGTSEAIRSFRGVLNYRIKLPRIEWGNFITEKAEREAAGKLVSAGGN